MALDWYLMQPPHDQVSGFESEALDDFGVEGFLETLDTDIADRVDLYNYDFTEHFATKAIVQNVEQDTKLQSLHRHLIVPIGTCHTGMYVKHRDRIWLIVGMVDNNGIYEKAVMTYCNYLLSWIDDSGNIAQRWANVISASQYNNGETSTTNYFVRTDQLLISIPDDDISLMLSQGQRFIIDKRCQVYEKSIDAGVVRETSKPVITYEITRIDSVIYNYQTSGHQELMVTQDEQHDNDGYYVVNGVGYWLCDVPDTFQPGSVQKSKIEFDESVIYNGLEPTVFVAKFFDSHGHPVIETPHWSINCDFADKLDITEEDNYISISVNDKKQTNKTFELILNNDGYELSKVRVTVKAFI